MTKRQKRMLKYIYKHPRSTESDILREFPDFMIYKSSFIEYLFTEDESVDMEDLLKQKLSLDAMNLKIPVGKIPEYIASHMSKEKLTSIPEQDDNRFYFTNLKFQEYLEKQRRDFLCFILPYGITTIIAIVSLIAQFCTY